MANNDFFLDPDESQTFGNIKFMRKSVRVKRTFPKTSRNKSGFAVEKEISSLETRKPSTNGYRSIPDYIQPESNSNNNSADSFASNDQNSSNNGIEQRRQEDSSMDLFLNMARSIKKR